MADALHGKCDSYLGLNFSEELLEIAKNSYKEFDDCHFQFMSATDIKEKSILDSQQLL